MVWSITVEPQNTTPPCLQHLEPRRSCQGGAGRGCVSGVLGTARGPDTGDGKIRTHRGLQSAVRKRGSLSFFSLSLLFLVYPSLCLSLSIYIRHLPFKLMSRCRGCTSNLAFHEKVAARRTCGATTQPRAVRSPHFLCSKKKERYFVYGIINNYCTNNYTILCFPKTNNNNTAQSISSNNSSIIILLSLLLYNTAKWFQRGNCFGATRTTTNQV